MASPFTETYPAGQGERMKKIARVSGIAVLALTWTLFCLAAGAAPTSTGKNPRAKSGFLTTPDGVRIHYLESGRARTVGSAQVGNPPPPDAVLTKGNVSLERLQKTPAILFIPGWTMPSWIWEKQIDYFSKDYRVVAMDPRAQGDSSHTSEGLYPTARARDIRAVVNQLNLAPVVLVGWSMAVNEVVSYVDQFGTEDVAGLILVDDDAGGLTPAAAEQDLKFIGQIQADREKTVSQFIRESFFKKPQPESYVDRVIRTSLRVPSDTAVALLVGKFAADYRPALAKIDKPTIVCAARSSYMAGIVEMQKHVAKSRLEIFEGDGHALFVDDPDKYNALLEDFLVGLR
jgi:non-heme chloroperoxidase